MYFKMNNILIVNQPLNNRGDEAAHKSLLRSLNKRFPSTKITVLFQSVNTDSVEQMKVDHKNNSYINIDSEKTLKKGIYSTKRWALKIGLLRLSSLHPMNREITKYIKQSDLVMCAPGGICMGLFQNWNHVYILSLAMGYGKRVAYYSRSFGPFLTQTKWDKVFKKASFKLLQNFDFLSIRDDVTMKLATEIGVPYVASIDTAFLDVPNSYIPRELASLLGGADYCVFVPNSLIWHRAFNKSNVNSINDFYIKIVKATLDKYKQMKIVMLPQLFNRGADGDEIYFRELKRKSGNNERIIIIPETYSSDIQQKIISQASLMIGARYHSIVFAINNNVPFVALSYEHKIRGLLRSLKLEKYMVDIELFASGKMEAQKSIKQINKIMDEAEVPNKDKVANAIAVKCMDKLCQQYQ